MIDVRSNGGIKFGAVELLALLDVALPVPPVRDLQGPKPKCKIQNPAH